MDAVARRTPTPQIDRRGLFKLASAGLLLGLAPKLAAGAPADIADGLAQRFLRIDPDGTITIFAKHLDMGQGIWSGLASIVAEELDADWAMVRVEGAPARMPDYAHILFKSQTTGGSTSISNSWQQLREAGATARAMLIAAAARRWKVAPADIVAARGMLRCGPHEAGYGAFAAEAGRLPVPATAKLKAPADFTLLGTRLPRLDVAAKTRGETRYGIDMRLDGMAYAVVRRAPRFGGKLRRVDATAARAVRGVLDVVEIPSGVAVVAASSWAAIKGRAALLTEWDDGAAEIRSTTAIMATYRLLAGDPARGFTPTTRGDPTAAFAGTSNHKARIVEAEFEFPYLAHAPMEPLALAGRLIDGRCELHGAFQSQTANQAAVAKILGLAPEQVSLETLPAGGSFGRRASFTSDWVVELAHLLKATAGRWPIKLMWTREDDLAGGYYRPTNFHRLRAAIDADGAVTGVEQVIVGQSILFGQPTGHAVAKPDPLGFAGNFVEQYDCPHARLRWVSPEVGVPVHTFRSISNNHTALSKEIFVDRLARAAGTDPVAYRLAHLTARPKQLRVLRLAAGKAGWDRPLPAGWARGVAVHESENSCVAQIVELSGTPDAFRIERVVCVIDCGLALNPDNIRAQMEGGIGFGLSSTIHGAITMAGGEVVQHNFDSYKLLRIDEMPRIVETHIYPSEAPPTGVGEPGSVPIGAALVNALEAMGHAPVTRFPLKGATS